MFHLVTNMSDCHTDIYPAVCHALSKLESGSSEEKTCLILREKTRNSRLSWPPGVGQGWRPDKLLYACFLPSGGQLAIPPGY